jgi:hypothetical protein
MLLRNTPIQANPRRRMPLLKQLFWVYFLLLIFEGALRKWVVPQLSTPLLLVRDPIAIMIIWEAYRTRKWPSQWTAVTAVLAVGLVVLAVVQMVAVNNPWFAALYGLRSYLLPFPVAFIMGESLDDEDLRKFGLWTLWLLLPLTSLEIMQYSSPSNSFWNAGASLGATQLGLGGGHVRASATFSYVIGPILFIPMAAGFVFYGMADPRLAKKWLLGAAAVALILAIPITGSRTLVYEVAALLLLVGAAALFGVSEFVKSLQMIVILLFVFGLVSQLPIFADATNTLSQRFADANEGEGGSAQASIMLRVVDPITSGIEYSFAENDLLGIGLGHGANAITKLLTGSVDFLAGEVEFARIINEFGWPCGLAFMLFRFALAAGITIRALGRVREGQPLAWLLVPVIFQTVVLGGLDQPTSQGFMVISVAFSLVGIKAAKLAPQPLQVSNPRSGQIRSRTNPSW